jgi:hypothetical protein
MDTATHMERPVKLPRIRIVGLGCQCSVSDGLKRSNIRTEAFPFDNVLSHLPEVSRLVLLTADADDARDVEGLVGTEFYANLERSYMEAPPRLERYHLGDGRHCFTDVKSKLTFPHDGDDDQTASVERFRRRFRRLREALDGARSGEGPPVLFVYADPGSPNVEYSLDGEAVTTAEGAFESLCVLSDQLHLRGVEHRILYFSYLTPQGEHPRVATSVFLPRDHWFAASDAVHHATACGIDALWSRRCGPASP